MIYLDYNATTPLDEAVREAMTGALPFFGNPSSGHSIGRAARRIIEDARHAVAGLLSADPGDVLFTSGGTEANNLAIIGTAFRRERGHIITSVIEHPSVINPARWLEGKGFSVTFLPVDRSGMVDPDDVTKAIRPDTVLITIMHANNETGVIQPLRDIGLIARSRGILFHTDAAQSVGKVDVSVDALGADMLTVVPHKFYGPKGIGALFIRGFSGAGDGRPSPGSAGAIPLPILFGAGHERGMRPGTENTVAIAGLGKACEVAALKGRERAAHTHALRELLLSLLQEHLTLHVNGRGAERLPNTLNISVPGVIADDVVQRLSDRVALSSGSACHAGMRRPSAVLKAMGLSDDDALASLRLSLGKDNTAEEITRAAGLLVETVRAYRK